MNRVLFVCVHNSGRSQIAEAFFNLYVVVGQAFSAGTQPAECINATVLKVMDEIGIDIHNNGPEALTIEMLDNADRVITMGCSVSEACPASLVPTEEWQLEDPDGKSLEEVRRIRDMIEAKVKALIEELKSST